jgi:Flp pilus assembly protein TadG
MHLRHWRGDERGVAATEFALMAPIMMLLYYGAAEFTMAMMANGRAGHVASVIGDLTSQTGSLHANEMTDIFTVGNAIMKPFPTTPLKLRVSSVKADSSGVPKILWSCEQGLPHLGNGTAAGFPPGLLAAGDSVIMAEVQYTYDSPIHKALPAPLTFQEKYYIKPRRSSEVLRDSGC